VTREEVYLTGKENIEGLMCVLNCFLPQMASDEVSDAAFINVSNVTGVDKKEKQGGQLFFNSILAFKDEFTKNLPKHVGGGGRLSSINVKIDFSKLKTD
jgi:hypothetical protein